MNESDHNFSAAAFVKAALLTRPLYREETELWDSLRVHRDQIKNFFLQIGQDLVVDEADGFAFIRQIEDAGSAVPRISIRRPLGFLPTVLLACLREDFCRFENASDTSTKLVKTKEDLYSLIQAFVAESTNQVKDLKRIDIAIASLVEMEFLKPINTEGAQEYEVMRILKAKIGIHELEEIKQRLKNHVRDE